MKCGSSFKIAALRFAPYALPFAVSFRTARESLKERKGWLLCVEDETGAWGMGEAAPLAGFGMESYQAAGAALAEWSRSLPGREVNPLAALDPALEGDPSPAFGLAASQPGCQAASHALELALLDVAARRAGLSLARFLSPESATEIRCNALLSADDPDTAGQRAGALVALGYDTLKVKVGGENPGEELERLGAIREAVGGAVKLRIDANGSWTEAGALPLLEKLAPLGIEYVEQPLPREALAGMARLAENSPIPIAADEAVLCMEDARTVLRMNAARVLVLKPMALGGVLTALQVARLAARQEAKVVMTTMLEGSYGRAGAAHAAAALAAIPGVAPYAHGLATGVLLAEDLAESPLEPEGGSLRLPDTAGLGIERPAAFAEPRD